MVSRSKWNRSCHDSHCSRRVSLAKTNQKVDWKMAKIHRNSSSGSKSILYYGGIAESRRSEWIRSFAWRFPTICSFWIESFWKWNFLWKPISSRQFRSSRFDSAYLIKLIETKSKVWISEYQKSFNLSFINQNLTILNYILFWLIVLIKIGQI